MSDDNVKVYPSVEWAKKTWTVEQIEEFIEWVAEETEGVYNEDST